MHAFLAAHAVARDGGAARGRARRRASRPTCPAPSTSIRTGGASCRCALEALAARRALRRARRDAGAQRGRAPRPARAPRARHAGARSRAPPTACSSTASFTLRRRDRARCPTSRALGVSHVYCSPYPARARRAARTATTSSTTTRSIPRSATRADFDALRRGAARARHGPAARHRAQPHGRAGRRQRVVASTCSRTARPRATRSFFDIDWQPLDAELAGKVLLPVLGDQYGVVLERGELRAARSTRRAAAFALRYFEHRFPLDSAQLPARAGARARALVDDAALAARRCAEPRRRASAACRARDDDRARRTRRARARQGRCSRRGWRALAAAQPARGAPRIDARGRRSSTRPTPAATRCTRCSSAQAYRLAYWRVAADEINYRRFFDINDLAALRMEHDGGVRGDAPPRARPGGARARSTACASTIPTACYDPAQYFERLQQATRSAPASSCAGADGGRAPLYVVVEKIAAPHEDLPRGLGRARHHRLPLRQRRQRRCSSTQRAADALDAHLPRASPASADAFDEVGVPAASASSCARALAARARRCSPPRCCASRAPTAARATTRSTRCAQALAEVVACFPVYRTYIAEQRVGAGPRATSTGRSRRRARRSRAADAARLRLRARRAARRGRAGAPPGARRRVRRFATQLPAVHRAGDGQGRRGHGVLPLQPPGLAERRRRRPGELRHHGARASTARAPTARAHWPHTMLATSTHDNKRSEDVRARIDVLSEMPARVAPAAAALAPHEPRPQAPTVDGAPAPVAQRRVPALPDAARHAARQAASSDGARCPYRERIEPYMLKAVREAKAHTQLDQPERGLRGRRCDGFVRGAARRGGSPTCSSTTCARRRGRARLVRRAATACRWRCSSSPRPACPTSTRAHELIDSQPGRPRQPPAGRLRAARERGSTSSRPSPTRPSHRPAMCRC